MRYNKKERGLSTVETLLLIAVACIIFLSLFRMFFPEAFNKVKENVTSLLGTDDGFASTDKVIANMEEANLAYNIPRSMTLGETKEVLFVLDLSKSSEDLRKIYQEQTDVKTARARVSSYMEAKLRGSSFDITEITPARQPLSRIEESRWRWSITAKEPGKQKLHLTLNAIINGPDGERTRSVETYDREIDVQVTIARQVSTFVRGNWQWLWTTVAIPVGVWLLSQRRKNKKKQHAGFINP